MKTRLSAWFAALALLLGAAMPGMAQQPSDVVDGAKSLPTVEVTPPAAAAAPAFGGGFLERSRLTGDWCGMRNSLAECGITLDVSSTQYYQGITSGGRQQEFEYSGHNDYFLDVDGQKAGLW